MRVTEWRLGWMVGLALIANLGAASSDLRLVDAVREGDHEAVRSLIKERADVNAPQAYGATALAWAANRDDLEMVELLIGAGAHVNTADVYGVTPLSLACTNGNAAVVEKLLRVGANPNAAKVTGETPLMTCARTGNREAVKSLLVHGADVNARENERGQTALMWAVAQEHPKVVGALVEHGADLQARSATVPLYTPKIINKSSGAVIEFYSKNVYFPKVKGGFTPLMFAGQAGALDSARILLAAGADVNDATPDDGSALVLASSNGLEKVALLLLEKGADPNATDGYGLTALHWALQEGIVALFSRPYITDRFWVHPNMPELVRALLAHGADPNARITRDFLPYDIQRFARTRGNSLPQVGLTGGTPFLLAAAAADLGAMRVLVKAGADPKAATEEGTTPLMVAAGMGPERGYSITKEQQKNFLEAVQLTLQWGNDVNAVTLGERTALHGAALYGLTDVIELLAKEGSDLDAQDMYGQTALSIAMADPDGLVYRHLKDYNPDDRFRRRRGGPHQETVELLLKLGATPYVRNGRNIKVF
ncbi:MAG: ankyrin repeat domain-containing protein [Acidobacteria bacterium]|nr:ankyrin repeat domain-containing protein [Acidobacteriota bacterium]